MIVVLNENAGGKTANGFEAKLRELFRHEGTEVRIVRLSTGANLHAMLQAEHLGPDETVVAGGGDGTLNAVAAELVGTANTLGVLPLGTLNHFAKDLGIPLELEGAVHTVLHGQASRVDVGEVNGRIFVNNSGLGLYPKIVHHREEEQEQHGSRKWPAFVRAALYAFRRYPFLKLRVTLEGRKREFKTPFVFVGNNEYQVTGLGFGGRTCLNNGKLGLYLGNRTSRLGLVRLALRAMVGRLQEAKDFEVFCLDHARIESDKNTLLVSVDGEVTRMTLPLLYRIRSSALRVLVPTKEGGA